MLRFMIRELLLLTALAATLVAWRIESRASDLALRTTRAHAERSRESLDYARGENAMLADVIKHPEVARCWTIPHAQWQLVDQPIP